MQTYVRTIDLCNQQFDRKFSTQFNTAANTVQMPYYQTSFYFDNPRPAAAALGGTKLTTRQARKQYNERQGGTKMSWEEEQKLIRQNKSEDAAEQKALKAKEAREARAAKAQRTRSKKKAELRREELERIKSGRPLEAKWQKDEPTKITGFFRPEQSYKAACADTTREVDESDDPDLPTIQELCAQYADRC